MTKGRRTTSLVYCGSAATPADLAGESRFCRDASKYVPLGDLGREGMVKPSHGVESNQLPIHLAPEVGATLIYALKQSPA
jgi:hypothetical protein